MYLGTPQTTFTIYRKLAERNYRPFIWPARIPRKIENYEGLMAIQLQEDIDHGAQPWDVTDPDRFDNDDLIEREASMGRSNFMLQFMLDTSLSDAENSRLNVQIWLLLLLILPLLQMLSSGVATPKIHSKTSQRSDYLEIISTVQCSFKETGILTQRQSAR